MYVRQNVCHGLMVLLLATIGDPLGASNCSHQSAIQFDVPSVIAAVDATRQDSVDRQLTVTIPVTSSVLDSNDGDAPPIDHMIVRCQFREALPIVGFAPTTQLASEFVGPISRTQKHESTDA